MTFISLASPDVAGPPSAGTVFLNALDPDDVDLDAFVSAATDELLVVASEVFFGAADFIAELFGAADFVAEPFGAADFLGDVAFVDSLAVAVLFVAAALVTAPCVALDFVALDFVALDFVALDFVALDFVAPDFVAPDFVAADFEAERAVPGLASEPAPQAWGVSPPGAGAAAVSTPPQAPPEDAPDVSSAERPARTIESRTAFAAEAARPATPARDLRSAMAPPLPATRASMVRAG